MFPTGRKADKAIVELIRATAAENLHDRVPNRGKQSMTQGRF